MMKKREERPYHAQRVYIDRRKADDDVIEHVIRGVRLEYVRTTSDDYSAQRRRRR